MKVINAAEADYASIGVTRRYCLFEDSESVKVELEELNGMVFIHVELKFWNIEVAKFLMDLWEELKLHLEADGYDQLFTYNADMKFTRLISKQEWHMCGKDPFTGVEVYYTDIGE